MAKEGKLIVFSAPSGSGKTTIVHHLLKVFSKELSFSISATSRKKRGSEMDGKDYYFISLKKFQSHMAASDFVEWEEVYKDNYYGTLRKEIDRIWELGKHVIFDIDVVGGLNIKKQFPEKTLAIFVQPPSIAEMENRLRNRKTDSEEKIKERVAKAEREMKYAKNFDVILLNDKLETAKKEAEDLIKNFMTKK